MKQRDGLQKLNRLNFRKHLLVDQAVATGFPIVAEMEFLRRIPGSAKLQGVERLAPGIELLEHTANRGPRHLVAPLYEQTGIRGEVTPYPPREALSEIPSLLPPHRTLPP